MVMEGIEYTSRWREWPGPPPFLISEQTLAASIRPQEWIQSRAERTPSNLACYESDSSQGRVNERRYSVSSNRRNRAMSYPSTCGGGGKRAM